MVNHRDNGTAEFAYFRPGASSVALAGDFNGWQTDSHQLENNGDGWWKMNVKLAPGEYRFKYIVDGTMWEADFAAYGVEMSKIGGWTSVLYIAEPIEEQVEDISIAA